jgi:hypothetical protein
MYFREGKSEAARRVMTAAELTITALSVHVARIAPREVTLPLETDAMHGLPMDRWPTLTRTLLFTTSSGGPVLVSAFQSAARFALNRAGLLPALPIESRSVRDPASGRYAANGGPQRPHHPGNRYERPSDHGYHFHALRYFWPSLMLSRGVPGPVVKDEIGHELYATLSGGSGYDVTYDTYARAIAEDRKRIRKIIDDEFAPFLPGLAGGSRATA